jgi:hypothetical protein
MAHRSAQLSFLIRCSTGPDLRVFTKMFNDTCYMHSIQVSQRQRVDAELLYLSRTAHELFPSDAARAAAHPRWTELCKG